MSLEFWKPLVHLGVWERIRMRSGCMIDFDEPLFLESYYVIMADILKTKSGEKEIKEIPCIKTKQEKSEKQNCMDQTKGSLA